MVVHNKTDIRMENKAKKTNMGTWEEMEAEVPELNVVEERFNSE